MKNTNKYQNKHILVLGLAVSGFSAAKLLHTLGAVVTVNDFKDLSGDDRAEELEQLGIKIVSGGHPDSLLNEPLDLIVKNPGIPYTNPLIQKAEEQAIPIVTDVEVAYDITESPIIAITGTNGKTTTTKMIEAILKTKTDSGNVFSVGNIGTPVSDIAKNSSSEDTLLMETSSFQLMGTVRFKPAIAVFTNIHSAHLDYHGSRKEYVEAKLNITRNQTEEDYLIYNHDQMELTELILSTSKAQLIPFSRKDRLASGVYLKENSIFFNQEKIMDVDDIALPGNHNLENALAAIAVAKLRDVKNEDIQEVLKTFHGVPHRLHFVGEVNGRKFYNDSKATNSLATINALEGFTNKVLLIAGGLDRGDNFEDLLPVFRKHVKALFTFGETNQKLSEIGNQAGVSLVSKNNTVSECVETAFNASQEKDVVLLSPACASWDAYADYQERGQDFINSIEELKKSSKKGE
ncbi:MAG: UDP-N-acetylmuramoyl-L-alanine--D-glutamate ligase [Alkalibacterium sp.]|nr:UDP-N-acetylmuramoyl-L-alanine--D-glutamate ligase [Alkalibacterium sp.]